jgi:type VI protein secretion system component VasK
LEIVVELLSSGKPWLVALGVLALCSVPMYFYIREIRRQRDEWKDRWESEKAEKEKVRESRLEEMKSTKQALKESVAVNEKLLDEMKKQREKEELIDEISQAQSST